MANDNKWSRPTNPPPPLFLGKTERDLVKQVNDELIERVIGQQILYLPVSRERTNFHPLYGEAIHKSFLGPVRVHALVEFEGIQTTTSHYGLDKDYKIVVNFHKRRLAEDQDLYVREGDYVRYGNSFYEIVSLNEGRQLFGQVDHLFQIQATCIKTRKGVMSLDNMAQDVIDALNESYQERRESHTEDLIAAGILEDEAPAAPVEDDVVDVVVETFTVQDIVWTVYVYDLPSDIPAGTALSSLFNYTGDPLMVQTAAIYQNGLRQILSASPLTGDFYIVGGDVYNARDIEAGARLYLEVLTIIE